MFVPYIKEIIVRAQARRDLRLSRELQQLPSHSGTLTGTSSQKTPEDPRRSQRASSDDEGGDPTNRTLPIR
jgi:hypothetical protein